MLHRIIRKRWRWWVIIKVLSAYHENVTITATFYRKDRMISHFREQKHPNHIKCFMRRYALMLLLLYLIFYFIFISKSEKIKKKKIMEPKPIEYKLFQIVWNVKYDLVHVQRSYDRIKHLPTFWRIISQTHRVEAWEAWVAFWRLDKIKQ